MVTYHPILPSLEITTRQYLNILHTAERLRNAFPLPPLIAFCCPKNWRVLLVRAELTSNVRRTPRNWRCGDARCKTCPILMAKDEFVSHIIGKQYKVKGNICCKFSDVIYLIECKKCGHQYVGKTGLPFHCMMNGHQSDIVHWRTEEFPVMMHFNNAHILWGTWLLWLLTNYTTLTPLYSRPGWYTGILLIDNIYSNVV